MPEICNEIVLDYRLIALSLALAHSLAWLFNLLVDRIGSEQEGYTWLLVTTGVAVTLILSLVIIPWQYIAILFAFFIASGLPMAFGDIARTKKRQRLARRENLDRARITADEVLNGPKREA